MQAYIQNKFQKLFLILAIQILCTQSIKAQAIEHILNFKSNPTNETYWWLEKNNYGKSIADTEFEYIAELTQSKTVYRINISNAYKDIN